MPITASIIAKRLPVLCLATSGIPQSWEATDTVLRVAANMLGTLSAGDWGWLPRDGPGLCLPRKNRLLLRRSLVLKVKVGSGGRRGGRSLLR